MDQEAKVSHTKKATAQNKVMIGRAEDQKIRNWLEQIKSNFESNQSVSKSDLVNFLIQVHGENLSTKEMQAIQSLHYDPVKHLNWIAIELKSAIAKGNFERVAKLQGEIRSIELAKTQIASEPHGIIIHNSTPKNKRSKKIKEELNSPAKTPDFQGFSEEKHEVTND